MAMQEQTRWAREYETVYVVDPRLDQDEIKNISNRMVEVIAKMNGKLTRLDHWGRRKLAYRTQNKTRGFYLCMRYLGYSDIVAELERNLRMQDVVFRFQTSRLRDKCTIDQEQVDPANIEFRPVDLAGEEPEPTLEQQLGLVESSYASRQRLSERASAAEDGEGSDDADVAVTQGTSPPEAPTPATEESN
ncbi:MAG: 30S ribosomal protein S6 [Myxococcales bacterium]|nr:30S ribosomal protein S6 [Myxococcales bacterium]MCB9709507.1 30S ribosomal protein S6 [Myxococcales bacterium]